MSKIDEALTFSTLDFEDEPTAERFISPLRLDMIRREDQPLLLPPWIPSPEEIESIKADWEDRIFQVFAVPRAIMITFTITPFEPAFETELAELDRKDEAHEGPCEEFEYELEDLDWAEPPSDSLEAKLAMLDYEDAETK